MATPCCPLCRGDLGAGLTPQQARGADAGVGSVSVFSARATRWPSTRQRWSNAPRVRARMMAAPLRPLGEGDGLLGGEPQRFTPTDEDPVF